MTDTANDRGLKSPNARLDLELIDFLRSEYPLGDGIRLLGRSPEPRPRRRISKLGRLFRHRAESPAI